MFFEIAILSCICSAISTTSALNRQLLIIGGDPVSIHKVPYQVSIYNAKKKSFSCGGSIISKEHVLTAAHCFDDKGHENLIVRSGSTYWLNGGAEHKIEKIWRHEGYKVITDSNDIALIKVSQPFQIDNVTTKIIDLFPKGEDILAGQKGFVAGWGRYQNDNKKSSEKLQGLYVTIMDLDFCKQVYAEKGVAFREHQFCAANADITKDFCNGDSGGPLVVGGRQAGIVSWNASPCAVYGIPGVYTTVSDYRDWIAKHM